MRIYWVLLIVLVYPLKSLVDTEGNLRISECRTYIETLICLLDRPSIEKCDVTNLRECCESLLVSLLRDSELDVEKRILRQSVLSLCVLIDNKQSHPTFRMFPLHIDSIVNALQTSSNLAFDLCEANPIACLTYNSRVPVTFTQHVLSLVTKSLLHLCHPTELAECVMCLSDGLLLFLQGHSLLFEQVEGVSLGREICSALTVILTLKSSHIGELPDISGFS